MLDANSARMASDLRVYQLEQKLAHVESKGEERVSAAEAQVHELEAKELEHARELEEAEEEKYMLANDMEVLQEELRVRLRQSPEQSR